MTALELVLFAVPLAGAAALVWRRPASALFFFVVGLALHNAVMASLYAAGVRDSLMNFIEGRPIRDDYVMVSDGEIQSGSDKAIYG